MARSRRAPRRPASRPPWPPRRSGSACSLAGLDGSTPLDSSAARTTPAWAAASSILSFRFGQSVAVAEVDDRLDHVQRPRGRSPSRPGPPCRRPARPRGRCGGSRRAPSGRRPPAVDRDPRHGRRHLEDRSLVERRHELVAQVGRRDVAQADDHGEHPASPASAGP